MNINSKQSKIESSFNPEETPDQSFEFVGQGNGKILKNEGLEYVLEEINEVQTNLVNFFTIMFQMGILLIPIQIIVYEDIKPYEISAIKYLQSTFGVGTLSTNEFFLIKLFLGFSSINFLSSLNVFFYYFTDTMVAFKACLLLGSCSYVVYALKLLIHDSRPFWIDQAVLGLRCKTSFGCPTLVFTGMFYFNYMIYNISRRIHSGSFESSMIKPFVMTEILSIVFILIMFTEGFILVLFGENFIYQIICSVFYVYLFLRIIIVFDELISHYAKNARIRETTSRMVAIYVFFIVILLSIFSMILYTITSYDLQIPLNWSQNIANTCPKNVITDEISTKDTLLASCSIFQVMGAAFGLYIVLNNIKNKEWSGNTSVSTRMAKGVIAFSINYLLIYTQYLINFKSFATEYIINSLIFFISGIFSYGVLPLIFQYLGLNSADDSKVNDIQLGNNYIILDKHIK